MNSIKAVTETYYTMRCFRCEAMLEDNAKDIRRIDNKECLIEVAHRSGWFVMEEYALCPDCQQEILYMYLSREIKIAEELRKIEF